MDNLHWVFGYGSLIWKQDFPVLEIRRAYIEGWARRFWQGSHDHRGLPTDPGRVLTLIETPGEVCWGRALLVHADVFEHLDYREKNGYERHDLAIHFDDADVKGMTYVAPTNNPAFLGAAPSNDIVAQIRRSKGPSGTNTDYVLELAQALRELDIDDPHVFEIEGLLKDS
jgi:cation transport protein ChaC